MSTGDSSVVGQTATNTSVRNWLIGATLAVAAAIVFGVLYLFVIAPSIPNGNVGWFLFSFATGLTMIIMPCTLPLAFVIVPLSMGKGLVRGLGMAVAFGLGIALTLSLYGVVAALLGGVAIDALGVGLEGLKNWIYFFAGTFALIFALSEIGLLNIHMPTYTGAAPAFIQKRQEILKAFFLGLFLGNVGVGCPHPATPLILIEIASSGDVFYGWLLFLVHAIGRILPLLLLAFLAILGVNGLNWLMARKAALERITGWAMVFVTGFILTLGLFTHDWWVNSGIHSALETLTQESKFNTLMNNTLGTNVAHVHGLEEGVGLFGQPLEWGNYFLVLVWLVPIWWWYSKKRKALYSSPSFKIQALEADIDRLERDRRQIESTLNIDELEVTHDLKHTREEIDALEAKRREEEKKVEYGETGELKNPVARAYEEKLLGVQRNYLIVISVFLVLIFVHFLPNNFYFKSISGVGHHDSEGSGSGAHDHGAPASTNGTAAMVKGTPFDTSIANLPEAQGLQFVELKDGDSYTVTASYVKKEIGNRTYRMLAYNGSIPGPFIKAPQNAQVTINFINNTDVDQTIHSHGVRVNNTDDGVPGVSQDVVRPGGSHTYTINFRDVGVAWYHPHTRDDYGQELGLYGNYITESLDPNYWSPVNRELPLMIDDILIENDQIAAFYQEFTNHALMGRFGNQYLVNGTTDYSVDVQKNEVVRLQITNASNARTYRLSLPGASLKVVGGDLGKYEQEFFADEVLISPAERVIVEVHFAKAGKVKLQNRMKNSVVTLAEFDVSEEEVGTSYVSEFNSARRDAALAQTFNEYRMYQSREPDKRLKLTVQTTGMVDHSAHAHAETSSAHSGHDMAGHDHGAMMAQLSQQNPVDAIEWGEQPTGDAVNTNQNVTWMLVDEATGKSNMNIPVADWTFKQGQLVKIRITNDMMAAHVMQHPIHLHGQRFVVLSENGVVNKNMVWKDTALVLPGGYIDILVDMSNTGEWMLHCHIVEHLFAGMMMPFRVEDQNGYANGDEYRASRTSSKQQSDTEVLSEATSAYTFDTEVTNAHVITLNKSRFSQNTPQDLVFSFTDANGTGLSLDQTRSQALKVWFVSRDNRDHFVSYPGNTEMQKSMQPMHNNIPNTPGFDESKPHSHSLHIPSVVSLAYADEGHAHEGVAPTGFVPTYTVPAVFTSVGDYKAFVEYYLPGETEPRIGVVNFTVGSWSIDAYGMSPQTKWWTLLIISIVLMVPFSLGVRKYINSNPA